MVVKLLKFIQTCKESHNSQHINVNITFHAFFYYKIILFVSLFLYVFTLKERKSSVNQGLSPAGCENWFKRAGIQLIQGAFDPS